MAMLSEHARQRLQWSDGTSQGESPGRIEEQFREAGVECFPEAIRAFATFGGGRFRMPIEGRFKIYYAREALRRMKLARLDRDRDPDQFRIPFGESETIQAHFLMDGRGRIYEDDRPVAPGMAEWIEAMGRA